MRMHVLSGGRLRMRASMYFPELPAEQTAEFPCSCFLIRHPQGNVLFDTGCHPAVETDASARWGGLARAFVPTHRPGENVVGGLAALALRPDDIDVVINSHLHMDHCGCNAFFTRATFFVHAAELAVAADPRSEGRGYFKADWDHPMPVRRVDATLDVFDDNRIVLLPLPGHTPGSMGAKLELDRSGCVVLAADAAAVRENLDRDYAPKNSWDASQFCASLGELRRLARQGATILFGHDDAQWRTLKKGRDVYD
ncbi:MAG TPA: N-acyl homoserine lactonase family protein [Candidatus Sulfotelmatobacter sp.]|nr:N-acyl homoserine lactonase family protein [Candidatus Sulfotelmatobacter sp.]